MFVVLFSQLQNDIDYYYYYHVVVAYGLRGLLTGGNLKAGYVVFFRF